MADPYNTPIRPVGGHGDLQVNAGYGWDFTGKERATGRVRKYYTRNSFGNKQELMDWLGHTLKGIEFIDGGPATKEPPIVFPMPPHSFQAGILEKVKQELQGDHRTRSPLRTLKRVRLLTRS